LFSEVSTRRRRFKTLKRRLTISLFVLLFAGQAYASHIGFGEGTTLSYQYARIGTSYPYSSTRGNSTVRVLALNQTTLLMQTSTTESNTPVDMRIEYYNGIPVYTDYVEALYYLPSECMGQSLRGNLNWTTRMATGKAEVVTGWASESLNLTVEAGSFESLNITLTVLAGLDSGALMLVYDVSSGIMIYEQWIPISGSQIYGDIIVFSLTAVSSPTERSQIVVNLVLAIAVFATPALMLLHGVNKGLLERHRRKRPEQTNIGTKDQFSGKAFYMIIAGGLLSLASTVLPWSQLAGWQVYLPLSLPSALAASPALFTSTSNLLATSLVVHASALMAWISIAICVYTGNKVVPPVVTTASTALGFISAITFVQTGWTASFGLVVILVAGFLALAGIVLANITARKGSASNS